MVTYKESIKMKMEDRIKKINHLIELIEKQENAKFFKNSDTGFIAKFECIEGCLYFRGRDEECGMITNKTTVIDLMEWVNNGNTIRNQIIAFAQFILTGEPELLMSRYWGIGLESQITIHKEAYQIGFIFYDEGTFHDYKQNKDVKIIFN